MRKIKFYRFKLLVYLIAAILIYLGLHYNLSYFNLNYIKLYVIPLKYKIGIYAFQSFCFLSALLIILFQKRILKRKKEITLLIITLLSFLIILEGISRIYICNFASEDIQSRFLFYGECYKNSWFSKHHYLLYYHTPNYRSSDGLNMHNSLGFRGKEIAVPKPNHVYRIVTLGGSTTYTSSVKDWKKDFARMLENEFKKLYDSNNIEVVNAGVQSYNSWESLMNLEFRVLDLDPDMIIIYHAINDVDVRLVNPNFYKGDNSGSRRPWFKKKLPFILNLFLFRLIINPSSGLYSYIDTDFSHPWVEEQGFNFRLNTTPINAIIENKPIYFERNLRNMIAVAKEHNISVLLATFAHSNQTDPATNPYRTPHYELGILEHNQIIKKVGMLHGIPVFDFASQMSNDMSYWARDGVHVNEKGSELKGKLFAKFIYNKDLISLYSKI